MFPDDIGVNEPGFDDSVFQLGGEVGECFADGSLEFAFHFCGEVLRVFAQHGHAVFVDALGPGFADGVEFLFQLVHGLLPDEGEVAAEVVVPAFSFFFELFEFFEPVG